MTVMQTFKTWTVCEANISVTAMDRAVWTSCAVRAGT
jgi:H+/gluconate symporter-like permease